jgi:hypothetical protein
MAFKQGNTIVSTLPVGARYLVTFDHTGPASYNQTTGDVIKAADLGFGGFEFVNDCVDTTSQFEGLPEMTNGGYGNAIPSVEVSWWNLTTATIGGQSQTLGTEVTAATNLSTFSVRLQAWMV